MAQSVARRIIIAASAHLEGLMRGERQSSEGSAPHDGQRPVLIGRRAMADLDGRMNHILQAYDSLSSPVADLAKDKSGYQTFFAFYRDAASSPDSGMFDTPASEKDSEPGVLQRREDCLRALLAAETEIQGKFQLRDNANVRLGDMLENLGAQFEEIELLWHAERAYQLAAERHRQRRDLRSQDRCLLRETMVRHAAEDKGLRKVSTFFGYWLAGFGYLPFRLLIWVIGQIVVFTGLVWLVSPWSVDLAQVTHICLLDYLNPLGLSDVASLKGPGSALLVAECYAGTISTSVFFALLVRRWFNA
jgi:hypothetical protein